MIEVPRFAPRQTLSKAIAHTTGAGGAGTDLKGLSTTWKSAVQSGCYVSMYSTTDVQISFNEAAVTLGSDDPTLFANTVVDFYIQPGQSVVTLKSAAANGSLFIWVSGPSGIG